MNGLKILLLCLILQACHHKKLLYYSDYQSGKVQRAPYSMFVIDSFFLLYDGRGCYSTGTMNPKPGMVTLNYDSLPFHVEKPLRVSYDKIPHQNMEPEEVQLVFKNTYKRFNVYIGQTRYVVPGDSNEFKIFVNKSALHAAPRMEFIYTYRNRVMAGQNDTNSIDLALDSTLINKNNSIQIHCEDLFLFESFCSHCSSGFEAVEIFTASDSIHFIPSKHHLYRDKGWEKKYAKKKNVPKGIKDPLHYFLWTHLFEVR